MGQHSASGKRDSPLCRLSDAPRVAADTGETELTKDGLTFISSVGSAGQQRSFWNLSHALIVVVLTYVSIYLFRHIPLCAEVTRMRHGRCMLLRTIISTARRWCIRKVLASDLGQDTRVERFSDNTSIKPRPLPFRSPSILPSFYN